MALDDIRGKAVRMPLPEGFVERRNAARREALIRRILAEFEDMPGMALSLKQAGRFLGVDDKVCARILAGLTRDGALRRNASSLYVRDDGAARRRR
jgi:hypothetical protein